MPIRQTSHCTARQRSWSVCVCVCVCGGGGGGGCFTFVLCQSLCLSIRPSVLLFVDQILSDLYPAQSIWKLHILSNNLRWCVAFWAFDKFQNFDFCRISLPHDLAHHVLASSGCQDYFQCTSVFSAATKQLNDWFGPSVCLSHLFDYVPIIASSWNFQKLLPMTNLTSMQKVKVRGQRSRSQRSRPNLNVSGLLLQFEFTYDDEIIHIASCC